MKLFSILFLFFFLATLISSCKGKVDSEKSINRVLREYYKSENFDKTKDVESGKYKYASHDLDMDGFVDGIIYLSSPYFCGTGGCNLVLFDGETKKITHALKLVSEPIQFGSSGNGKSVLRYMRSGGGLPSDMQVRLIDLSDGTAMELSEIDPSIRMRDVDFPNTLSNFLE